MTAELAATAPNAVETEDVEYQRVGDRSLLARLYRPRDVRPLAAVVEVHGGAWNSGDRLNNTVLDTALAAAGILVMAIDFRMPPEDPYPASIADVNLAIRWLKARAPALGVRTGTVGGLGTSSGGHQIMLSALRPRDPRFGALPGPGDQDASLPYVVACWPILDPLARYRMAQERGIERLVLAHDAYWQSTTAMADGNPQRIVERRETTDLPPTLVIQGTADDNVTPDMAERFAAAYRAAGGRLQLEIFPGQPHMFITKDPGAPAALEALEHIKAFIRRQVS